MKPNSSLSTCCQAALLAILCSLAAALPARAHAFLDHAEPAVGGSVHAPLAEVRLWFTMDLDAKHCQVQVFDAAGKPVDHKEVRADPRNPRCLYVSLPSPGRPLAAGAYKVVWRVRPAGEGEEHTTHGDFTFRLET